MNIIKSEEIPILYEVKEKEIKILKGSNISSELQVFIVRTHESFKFNIPSVFSSFVRVSGNSYNYRLRTAKFICNFLNYVIIESISDNELFINIKKYGLKLLNFEHAKEYLNFYINEKGNSFETIKAKSNCILNFYGFLVTHNIINVSIETIAYKTKDGIIKERIKSPFETYSYRVFFPEKITGSRKIKYMEPHILKLFFECCDKVTPEIKLGIYFQVMGGLRLGEVVNSTLGSLNPYETNTYQIDVLDNQKKLFMPHQNYALKYSQVKKPRYSQVILDPNCELEYIYNNHLKLMNSRRTTKTPKEALFIDKNGFAMTGLTYKNLFYKLKNFFLSELEKKSFTEYHKFSQRPWGTHIGRAIFTNYCIINNYCTLSNGDLSATILAKLRGDISLEASLNYIDDYSITKYRESTINKIKKTLDERIKGDTND